MVRTYRPVDNYHLVSPWEQAMRNADAERDVPVATGKRMYSDRNVTQLSGDRNNKNMKLPPITDDPQHLQNYLGEEAGKILARSKEKLKKIKNEIVLYDPYNSGLVPKSSMIEILKRYGVPKDEGSQRKLAELFQDSNERGKVNRVSLVEFLEVSKNLEKEKFEIARKTEQETTSQEKSYADNPVGRYDSEPTMQQNDIIKPKRNVRNAFAERRDAGLLLELENALELYTTTVNPHELLDELEDYMKRTCKNEDNVVDGMHMKSVMAKHQFPINTALIMKCIDRLDPNDTGLINWIKYIEFLRRAVKNSPRPTQSNKNLRREEESNHVPETPAWERKPLSSISMDSRQDNQEHSNMHPKQKQRPDDPRLDPNFNYLNVHEGNDNSFHDTRTKNAQDRFYDFYSQPSSFNDSEQDFDHFNFNNSNGSNGFHGNGTNGFHGNPLPAQNHNGYSHMNDNLGAAFADSLQKLRSESSITNDTTTNNTPRPNFDSFSTRGDAYKRVADALYDKAKFKQGVITVGEVEKLVNYYNLLFDTNIPMEQVSHVVNNNQSNGLINVKHIINSFGTEII